MTIERTRQIADVIERVAWTFVQAFIAIWAVPVVAEVFSDGATLVGIWSKVADTSILDKAAVGGIAAVVSLLKNVVTISIKKSNKTAATLPPTLDPVGVQFPTT